MKSRLKAFLRDDRGSAVVEFVLLALPLFIPLFLYLNQYSLHSDTEASLRTLGREMSRAFVTSENDEMAERVTYEVFVKGGNVLGFGNDLASNDLTYTFNCKKRPCISPNNTIEITLHSRKSGRSISTLEYVSPWA